MKLKGLARNTYLVKLDRRSGQTFNHFSHRIDINNVEDAVPFINWCQDNLGYFMPWNVYLKMRETPGFKAPNWALRYYSGEAITQLFIDPNMVPFIMLHWMPQK